MLPIVEKEYHRLCSLIDEARKQGKASIDVPACETLIEALCAVQDTTEIVFIDGKGYQIAPCFVSINTEQQIYTITL